MSTTSSRWRLLQTNGTGPDWLWLPGWSFKAEVFAPLYQSLPGRHFGFDYSTSQASFTEVAAALYAPDALTQEQAVIWVGWSLGGALAYTALASNQISATKAQNLPKRHTALITLASAANFCRLKTDDTFGVNSELLEQFSSDMQRTPDKTRKRFLALCTHGADDARSLSKQLAQQQLNAPYILLHSLEWLREYCLAPSSSTAQMVHTQQHWVGGQDALHAGGLSPTYTSPGRSHAFFLENDGKKVLLTELCKLSTLYKNKEDMDV